MVDQSTPLPPAGATPTSPGPAVGTPVSPKSAASSPKSPVSPRSPGFAQGSIIADENVIEDEALGSDDNASSSASLTSSILRYRHENGRRYHSFKDGAYAFPNDDLEAERMDFQHMMFQSMYGGALFLSPIELDANSSVLDAGTGTGLWAIDIADDNPSTKVIGVDLSAIQPVFVPPNAEFYVEDLEDPWTFTKPFDLIFARMLTGSIGNWPKFYKQSFDHLSPGGFIELTDIVFPLECDDNTLDKDSALYQWGKLTVDAAAKLGRPLRTVTAVAKELAEAGFTDIEQHHFKWPTNRWPRDPKMKELGAWTYEDVGKNVYGLTVALFTRGLGWTVEEFEIFLIQVRKEMKDPKIHGYFPIYAIHARKPVAI